MMVNRREILASTVAVAASLPLSVAKASPRLPAGSADYDYVFVELAPGA